MKPTIEDLEKIMESLEGIVHKDIIDNMIAAITELGVLRKDNKSLIDCIAKEVAKSCVLEAKLDKTKEYMRHKVDCNHEIYVGYTCDCGLNDTLKSIEKK